MLLPALVTIAFCTVPTLLGLLWSYFLIWRRPTGALAPEDSRRDLRVLRARLPLILANLALVTASTTSAFVIFPEQFTIVAPAPHVLALQLLLTFVFGDMCFYWEHRVLHTNRYLYTRIHHIHHRASPPLPIEYIYVHPLEWLIGSTGPALVFVGIVMTTGQLSLWTLWSYVLFRQLHELHIHSGFRATIGAKIPGLGTADHHDVHHAKPGLGNYGSIFIIWDKMFGTAA